MEFVWELIDTLLIWSSNSISVFGLIPSSVVELTGNVIATAAIIIWLSGMFIIWTYLDYQGNPGLFRKALMVIVWGIVFVIPIEITMIPDAAIPFGWGEEALLGILGLRGIMATDPPQAQNE